MMDLTDSEIISAGNFANVMGVSKATLQKWEENGTFVPHTDVSGRKFFFLNELMHVPEIKAMAQSSWNEEMQARPLRDFLSIELFAGGGGLALGMEKAGFKHVMLNEFDKSACETLRQNRPDWNVVEGDVCQINFASWKEKVDFISGGFPCQAFSYAGKGAGFDDARGTLFFQLARAVKEVRPKVFMGENVRGLAAHDNGRTLQVIKGVIKELGYTLVEPHVLKAICYMVPQKRERLFLIAIRNDYADKVNFEWPSPYKRVMTLRDAFFAGELYDTGVPCSPCQKYPAKKQRVMEMVPEGGDWRDLPVEVQKEYMGASFYLGGGKTGMARRLSLDEPSLTLTCSPAQKQTERCHPTETRPLSVREYARIQTFPDDWQFAGNLSAQYKQIGNAVPVNLAWAMGRALMRLMNQIELIDRGIAIPPKRNETFRHGIHYHTPEGEFVQLSLFEPGHVYLSADKTMLIGTCRQATRPWIDAHQQYNYPITKEDLDLHPELRNVKRLVLTYRKSVIGYFDVKGVQVVGREELARLDYPVKSSRHKADMQYLLYTLEKRNDDVPIFDGGFQIITGRGTNFSST